MVIGGSGNLTSEKCALSGPTMSCQEQAPILDHYDYHPGLFMVPEGFCTDIWTLKFDTTESWVEN